MDLGHRARVNLAVLGLGVVLVALPLCVHHWGIGRQLESLEDNFLTQAQLDRLVADQRLIAESGIFPAPTRHRNAGEILNPLVPLDGGTDEQQTPVKEVWWSSREVFDEVRGPKDTRKRGQRHPRKKQAWAVKPEAMPTGDLSITKTLLAYDHWETASPGGRYAEYLATDEHPFLASSPIPNLIAMQTLARLRLVQGILSPEGSDMLPALEETRHLARLSLSSETLIAAMIANAILSIEKRAYDMAVERGLLAPEAWTPASDDLREAIRRAGFGMVVVAMGWTVPDDAHDQLVATGLPLFNLCGGQTEAVFQYHALYPIWDTFPLERDLSHFGDDLRGHIEASPQCRLVVGREVLAHPERMNDRNWKKSLGVLDRDYGKVDWLLNVMRVPFVRGHLMLYVYDSIGMGDVFRLYGPTAAQDWRANQTRP